MEDSLKKMTLKAKFDPVRASDINEVRFSWPDRLGYSGKASVRCAITVPHLYAARVIAFRKVPST